MSLPVGTRVGPYRQVIAVTVEATARGLRFAPARALFEWNAEPDFTVGPRGEFYGIEPVPGAAEQTSLHLQTGWFGEVVRLAGPGGNR